MIFTNFINGRSFGELLRFQVLGSGFLVRDFSLFIDGSTKNFDFLFELQEGIGFSIRFSVLFRFFAFPLTLTNGVDFLLHGNK